MAASRKVNFILCVIGLCCWNLMVAIDATALAIALPTIANDLQASSTTIYWAGTSFMLCSAVFQPIFASLTSFGQKHTILGALTFFTTGSIICALAKNATTLIAGRCLQGMGGGGLIILTYIVMAHLFSLEQRSQYTSLIGIIWTIGTICGPLIGGGFAGVGWRWIFWLNLPFAALTYILVICFMNIENKSQQSVGSRLKRIDWIGCLLLSVALTLILIAISWGGVMYPWRSWGTLVPLILGVLVLLSWIAYSYKVSTNPMIPLVVLRDRTAAISYFGTVIHGLSQFGLLYYLPLYYQAAKGYSPIVSGLALLPQCMLSGPFTAITGILIAKTHLTRAFNIVGWLLFAYGLVALHLLDVSTSVFGWIVLNVPSGIGLGILFASLAMSTQSSAEARADCSEEQRAKVKAMAAGLNPFFRAVGQACGIAVGQAAFSNEISKRLGPKVGRDASTLVEEVRNMRSSDPQKVKVAEAFVSSLRVVWWVLVALTTLLLFMTLFTKDFGLKGAQTKEGDGKGDIEAVSTEEDEKSAQ